MSASTHSTIPEPDNGEGVESMEQKIQLLLSPPPAQPDSAEWPTAEEFDPRF